MVCKAKKNTPSTEKKGKKKTPSNSTLVKKKTPPKPNSKTRAPKKKCQKKMKLIEISSSCNAVASHATIPDSPETFEEQKLFRLEAKVSGLEASVTMLMEGVKNLTNIMTRQSAKLSQTNTLTDSPLTLTQSYTPRQSGNRKPLDEIVSKLKRNMYGASSEKVDGEHANLQMANKSLKKNLFSSLSITGQKCLVLDEMEPLSKANVDGMETSVGIPKWIPICFTPPDSMVLDESNTFVAAYLFGLNKCAQEDEEEVIACFNNKESTRNNFKTLLPGKIVDQQVINLIVSIRAAKERSVNQWTEDVMFWFLPSTISQYAIDWKTSPKEVVGRYQKDYMGKFHVVQRIFLPVSHMNRHWYLVIVDLVESSLIILDSLPGFVDQEDRRRTLRKMGVFLEEMLTDPSFYMVEATDVTVRCRPPPISEFPIVIEKELGSQHPKSNDGGVWVAKWLMDCHLSENYKIQVDDQTGIKLALDLALSSYNTNRDVVIKNSAANWDNLEKKHRSLVALE